MPNIDEAIEALLSYQQADMEGVMVLTSRQAIHEVADEMKRLRSSADSDEAGTACKNCRHRGSHLAWRCDACGFEVKRPLPTEPQTAPDLDQIALEAARKIEALNWNNPTQRTARIQCAVTEALRRSRCQAVSAPQPPAGYQKLPDGTRCRCPKMWQDGKGGHWCCLVSLSRPQCRSPEAIARAAGWIAEIEYNGEDDGVRHPASGNWSENWEGACRQIGAVK